MHAGSSSRLLAAAGLVILLSSACTPSPAPQPTPSPTPAVASPPETAQEREQRVAYAAAEESYRAFRTELQRVTDRGGAKRPTAAMLATAGGTYLQDYAGLIAAYRSQGYHTSGVEVVSQVHGMGYSPTEIKLSACEDSRSVVTYTSNNKVIGKGELRLTALTMRNAQGRWKVWSGDGNAVTTCD